MELMTMPKPRKKYLNPNDLRILAFLSKFPAATAEAVSMLSERPAGPKSEAGGLPEIASTEQRLRHLSVMGLVQIYTHIITKQKHYGLTAYGFDLLKCDSNYHYIENYRGIDGLSISRLNHYGYISLIASQFASPINYYADKLGLPQVNLEQIIGENELRSAYETAKKELDQNRKDGSGPKRFAEWRQAEISKALLEIKERRLEFSDLAREYPALLTIGSIADGAKNIHQPDLVLRLDDHLRTLENRTAKNVLVEIELTPKKYIDYEIAAKTFAAELKSQLIYGKIIYFTIGSQVENYLRKADQKLDSGLFDAGKIRVLPITHRDGSRAGQGAQQRVSGQPRMTTAVRNGILTHQPYGG
jgi:hypothetical protein